MTTSLLRVEASAAIGAAATDTYRMIADYKNGHPRILPAKYFRSLTVEKGGYGAGTEISFEMIAFGSVQKVRAVITEPEPGRVLVEADPAKKVVTTFTVEPTGAATSRVTFVTEMPVARGLLGWIQRALFRSYLEKVYAAELKQLDEQVRTNPLKA
jgi:hypothetical protein